MFVSEGQYPVMTRHNWIQLRCSRLWVGSLIWPWLEKKSVAIVLEISAEFGIFNPYQLVIENLYIQILEVLLTFDHC